MLSHSETDPGVWLLALVQGRVRQEGALEGQGSWGVIMKVRQWFGASLWPRWGEKGDGGDAGWEACVGFFQVSGGWGTKAYHLCVRLPGTVLCIFLAIHLWGLPVSSLRVSSPAPSPHSGAPPPPAQLRTRLSWLHSHPQSCSSSGHGPSLPHARPHRGSVPVKRKARHWCAGSARPAPPAPPSFRTPACLARSFF